MKIGNDLQDVLSTINHTTVEALGFKNLSPDIFVRNHIKVTLFNDGAYAVSMYDQPTDINSIDSLIKLTKTKSPEAGSDRSF